MSKSRGTFITVRNYLIAGFDPEYLRYYFASKLNDGVDDIDLNLTDFVLKVNSDLVGKVVNIASRCAGFISKNFDNTLSAQLDNESLFDTFKNEGEKIAKSFAELNFSNAIRMIMALADKANQYIDEKKPWVLAKQPDSLPNVQAICTMGLNLFRLLMLFLKPVLPKMAENAEKFLNIGALKWDDIKKPILNHKINNFIALMQRVDQEKINQLTYPNE
jgi:methionyl-tRNA synthetase